MRNRLAKIRAGSAQGAAAVVLVKNTLDGVGSEINDAYVWTDQLLTGMDYKTQDAVRPLFTQPLLSTWDAVLLPAAVEINTAWGNAVLEPWTLAFAGRYPFVDSAQDASLPELAKFVRDKDGLIWSFMRQNFDYLVVRQGSQIVPRQWAGKGINVRSDFLESINRLARVGEAVALKGEVGFRFYLQPEPQARIASTELELDGQSLKYQNGPQEWRLMSWPGPSTAPQLRVQAVVQASDAGNASVANGTAAGVQVAQYQRGPWAFMRALAAAQVERLDGGRARSWANPVICLPAPVSIFRRTIRTAPCSSHGPAIPLPCWTNAPPSTNWAWTRWPSSDVVTFGSIGERCLTMSSKPNSSSCWRRKGSSPRPCKWYLVERIPGEYDDTVLSGAVPKPVLVKTGEPAPHSCIYAAYDGLAPETSMRHGARCP